MELHLDPHGDTTVAAPRRLRDRGNTLPELLVAIVLMGFAFSAVIAGLQVVIKSSSTSDDQAKVEAVLTSAADRLSSWSYLPCPGVNGEEYLPIVEAARAAVDWNDAAVEITDVKFWDPSLGQAGADNPVDADGGWVDENTLSTDVDSTCNEDIGFTTSRTLQKVTIRVTSPDGDLTRSIQVVKSNIVADPNTTTTTTP